MSDNGQPPQQVPVLPWELHLNSATFDFEPRPDGGMILALIPSMMGPQGNALMPPGIKVGFDAAGWEMFKRRVAEDGKPIPSIPVARFIPPHP